MTGDVYNTTINVNGNRMFSSTFYPGNCCCGNRMFMANSCFGFGFGGFGSGLGMGLGFAAGMSLVPALPSIFKNIGSAFSWFGSKVIAPAASFTWNSVLKPTGKAIGRAATWTGKTIAKGAAAVGKGVSKLWNKIFHKKSKTKTEQAQ